MTIRIAIERTNGRFTAFVPGVPALRAEAASHEQAIALVKEALTERVRQGELSFLDLELGGLSTLAGRFAADPTLREICEEAYRLRDAELTP